MSKHHRTSTSRSSCVYACCAIVAGLIALTACQSPLRRDLGEVKINPERLQRIDAVTLEEKSRSAPVPVDQAATDVIEHAVSVKPPPATIDLSLADVRAAALENNLDLQVELINPSIAQQSVSAEEAKFESTFTASARRSHTDAPTSVATEGSVSTFDNYDLGVRVPLVTGGTIGMTLPLTRSETNNAFSTLNPAYTSDLRFSISQPLLRGAWPDANLHSIRVARQQKQITDARTKLEAIRILANADKAYWALYGARRELEVRQKQYELAVAQLERAKREVAAGDAPQIEILRAESGVAQQVEAIIIADSATRRRQRDLKRILNRPDLPMNSPTAITPVTEPSPVGLDLDSEALAKYALENRMEMLELELQLAIDSSFIDFQKNNALPLLTVDYSYGINGLGNNFKDTFEQNYDKKFEDWSVGISAEIPIGNEAAKARVRQAVLQRVQRLATREQRTAAIRQEVFNALDQLTQDWQRILAARQEAILAGRTYEAERRQFDVGARTSTDVLDAAARLADAQSREIIALSSYQIDQVDIAFATGTLLGHDRIDWAPVGLIDGKPIELPPRMDVNSQPTTQPH